MDERTTYNFLLVGWLVLAGAVFAALMRTTAPYGRFARPGWGPILSARLGWLIMESPAVVMVVLLFALGRHRSAADWTFLAVWNVHYGYRTFIYSQRLRSSRSMPMVVVASGMFFNVVNGYLQGRYLFALGPSRRAEWLTGPAFLAGVALFLGGLCVHVQADNRLRSFRRPGERHYDLPRGGLFHYVSCPNYLGEMVEWAGWALLTWSPAGVAFAVWTAANLLPRALACHRWYRSTFPDYPPRRRAVFPGIL